MKRILYHLDTNEEPIYDYASRPFGSASGTNWLENLNKICENIEDGAAQKSEMLQFADSISNETDNFDMKMYIMVTGMAVRQGNIQSDSPVKKLADKINEIVGEEKFFSILNEGFLEVCTVLQPQHIAFVLEVYLPEISTQIRKQFEDSPLELPAFDASKISETEKQHMLDFIKMIKKMYDISESTIIDCDGTSTWDIERYQEVVTDRFPDAKNPYFHEVAFVIEKTLPETDEYVSDKFYPKCQKFLKEYNDAKNKPELNGSIPEEISDKLIKIAGGFCDPNELKIAHGSSPLIIRKLEACKLKAEEQIAKMEKNHQDFLCAQEQYQQKWDVEFKDDDIFEQVFARQKEFFAQPSAQLAEQKETEMLDAVGGLCAESLQNAAGILK